ncbi:phage tail protein [Cognatiluteimonas telluris]|jgi:microcystin-dependent protein|uniref:phage tail protein n=1 Tax=Cognatiluteimonas telluris TaxID=1104775 RepID=UPI00140895C8|nr:tail fiber protein [Lysobacter telluris]
MSDPFLGQLQVFGFGFAPKDWASCTGQLLPISQYSALFSLLGTNFGGNGTTNFGLPNFQGAAACATGAGPGLSPRTIGEAFGSDSVTLLANEMPAHNHPFNVVNQSDAAKRHGMPVAGDALSAPGTVTPFAPGAAAAGNFAPSMIGVAGGGQPHANQQPYLAMNFCIALSGIFPQRP